MPFDPSVITDGPHLEPYGPELVVRWASSAPEGTVFQLYRDGRRVYAGTARLAILPAAAAAADWQVGAVDPAEEPFDLAATLPAPPGTGRRPLLSWEAAPPPPADDGPTAFRIYAGGAPGAAVDMTAPVAAVPAEGYSGPLGGFGAGGFGSGGFGHAAVAYTWRGPALAAGTWSFAVAPVGPGGVEGAATPLTVTIVAPPEPPAPFPDGLRVHGAYDPATGLLVLTWNGPSSAPPGSPFDPGGGIP